MRKLEAQFEGGTASLLSDWGSSDSELLLGIETILARLAGGSSVEACGFGGTVFGADAVSEG